MKNINKLMIMFALTLLTVPVTSFAQYTNQGSYYTVGDYNTSGYSSGGMAYGNNNGYYNSSYSGPYGYQTASVASAYPALPATGGGGKALANKIKDSSASTLAILATISMVLVGGFIMFRKSPADQFDMKV